MPSRSVGARSWHLWAVAVASLAWNSGGALDYVMTKSRNPDYLATATPEQLIWFNGFPIWMEIAWAIGVWGAIAGSLLLLFRSRHASTAFALSLAGLIVGTIYQYGIGTMPPSLKTHTAAAFTIALWFVAIMLAMYAAVMRRRGSLR